MARVISAAATEFMNKVKASYSCLWVKTHEEERALVEYVSAAAVAIIPNPETKVDEYFSTYTWDIASGLRKVTIDDGRLTYEKAMEKSTDPGKPLIWIDTPQASGGPGDNAIIFLKDYHEYLGKSFRDADIIKRTIRNILPALRGTCKCLVILSPVVVIPDELDKEIRMIDYKLPTRTELKGVLQYICESAGVPNNKRPTPALEEELINAALGMTSIEAGNAFCVSLTEGKGLKPEIIRREKSSIVQKSGSLEVVEVTETLADVGGLELLKQDLMIRKNNFTNAAHDFGVRSPKGIVFVGVPGCGKSLTAKATASAFGMPLFRLDVSKIFGKYVGESEGNMAKCLDIAAANAPCVLWIDELEKSMSGNKDGDESHETSKKVFGMLLNFLQERKTDVFLVATANSVKALPPELLRSGRIDKLYWVDLPDNVQREEILKIHLRKIGRNPDMFNTDMAQLVTLCDQFSGADIEQWVQEALNLAFASKHTDLMLQDLISTVGEITPTSRLMGDVIIENRAWALKHGCKRASPERPQPQPEVRGNGRRKIIGTNPENN